MQLKCSHYYGTVCISIKKKLKRKQKKKFKKSRKKRRYFIVYRAKRPPLVPGVQATKSLRKALSLDCQQNGRLPSNACIIVGGWESAKPLSRREE